MLEPLRSRYLDVLGIDAYVPRALLPAAKMSEACEWLSAVEMASVEIAERPAPVAPMTSPVSIPIEIERAIETPQTHTRVAPAPNKSAAIKPVATHSDAVPKFALSIALAEGGILLIDDAPATQAERSEFQKLIGNFLFALQRKTTAFGVDIFLWPMLKSATLLQDATAAREALNAHLHKQIQQKQIQRVLILGETAQRWCALEDTAQWRCLRSVSLLQCLREPQQKRELWRAVQQWATS